MVQPNNNGDLLLRIFDEGVLLYNSKTRELSRVFNIYDDSTLKGWCPHVETLHLLDIKEISFKTTQLLGKVEYFGFHISIYHFGLFR